MHCAATIVREEGLRGMWSGASPTVMRNGTNQLCLFWAKSHMDEILWKKQEGDGKQLAAWQVRARLEWSGKSAGGGREWILLVDYHYYLAGKPTDIIGCLPNHHKPIIIPWVH